MYCLATCSPNKARIGARSEKRLLLKSSPVSAKTTGIRAAKTDAAKSRDGAPNIFSQPGRAEGRQCSAADTLLQDLPVLSSGVVGCAVGRYNQCTV